MTSSISSMGKALAQSCLLCALLSLCAHALDSKQLLSTLSKTLQSPESTSMRVISTEASGVKDFWFVIVERDRFWIPLLAHESGRTIMVATPELILSADSVFSSNLAKTTEKAHEHNKQITDDLVLGVFKEHAKSTITLGSKSAKYTTYMVLDPNCPYCQSEVEKLSQSMKDSRLVIMVVGILRQDSLNKAAAFARLIKSAALETEQIAVLKRVFAKGFDPSSVQFDEGKKEQGEIYADLALIGMKLQQAGLQGVPYIIKRTN